MKIKSISRTQAVIGVVLALAAIGTIGPNETPQPAPAPPTAAANDDPLDKVHNGISGQSFIEFCMNNAGGQILQNPQTAKHPNLLQQNAPYLSASNDWAWQSWVEGTNLYGVSARVHYVCWRTPNGKVSFEVITP